jgi:hypothetical protein
VRPVQFMEATVTARSRWEILNHPGHPDQKVHGGGGANMDPDAHGNYREDDRWFDADGIYMTDGYVDQYGLPVTHSGFGDDRSGRFSVVLSTRGEIHIMRERDGGPADASYSRHAEDVRISGMTSNGARGLAGDVRWAIDRTTANRTVDEAGEDVAGDDFGVGQSRTNAATGVTVTSARDGAVVVSGLGRNGADLKVEDSVQLADSLETIADQ